jgi:4-hydroxy-tetrahydrodipicolinate reductase
MNAITTRMLLEKGVDIVGAVARSSEKVGRDLGEVAGLGITTGVLVEDDPDRVLGERSADIALIAVSSYMTDQYEHLRRCAMHGVNAITLSEESLYPWRTSPAMTAELDHLAKQNGVTLTGSGFQDTFWVNLVGLLMGTAHRIDSVAGRATWNVDEFGPELSRDQRVGNTEQEFDQWLRDADRPPTFGLNVLHALLADTGLTAAQFTLTTKPVIASKSMRSNSLNLDVPAGDVIGFTDVDEVTTREGTSLRFEMRGSLYDVDEADVNEWRIDGEPDVHVINPAVPTQLATCSQMVNRVPDVINAPPGFVTVEQLPRLRYRPHPLAQYLTA